MRDVQVMCVLRELQAVALSSSMFISLLTQCCRTHNHAWKGPTGGTGGYAGLLMLGSLSLLP